MNHARTCLEKFPYESEIYFNHIIYIYVMLFRNKEINLPFNNCLQRSFHENNLHVVIQIRFANG